MIPEKGKLCGRNDSYSFFLTENIWCRAVDSDVCKHFIVNQLFYEFIFF